MWRKLLRPEVLFLMGTLQMLLPYLIFAIGGVPRENGFQLSYYPMAITIIGYTCFWIGVKVGPRTIPGKMKYAVPVSMSLLKGMLVLMSVITIVEMIGLVKVYGGFPLLEFLSGAADVNDTGMEQANSGFGQIGASALTVYLLMGLISLTSIKARQEGTRVVGWLAGPTFLVLLLSVFNGKRQGGMMCIVILVCCSTIVLNNPFELIGSFLPGGFNPRRSAVIGVLIFLGVFKAIGGLANLRNVGPEKISTTDELALYYEWPVMGMSVQTNETGGFGPYEMKPLGPFKNMLPAKLSADPEIFGKDVPRFEISSPNGFYELLQWNTGLWGIIPFTFLCGLFCQYMYRNAFRGYASLLSYSLIAWALFSAPIYNHFFSLVYLPVPAAVFLTAAYFHRQFKRAVV